MNLYYYKPFFINPFKRVFKGDFEVSLVSEDVYSVLLPIIRGFLKIVSDDRFILLGCYSGELFIYSKRPSFRAG